MSAMIVIIATRIIAMLLLVGALAAQGYAQQEVDAEEASSMKTLSTRSDHGRKAQVVTGTFR